MPNCLLEVSEVGESISFVASIAALVTAIAACMSAVAAFVVVRQNDKQRAASYRPDFVLVRTSVKSKIFETNATGDLPHWTNDARNDRFSIPLVNVGLGAAREIRVIWDFPILTFIATVNRLAQESLVPVYFEFKNDWFS